MTSNIKHYYQSVGFSILFFDDRVFVEKLGKRDVFFVSQDCTFKLKKASWIVFQWHTQKEMHSKLMMIKFDNQTIITWKRCK